MKIRLRPLGAAAAAATLAASLLLVTPGTAHAADTATITVNVVDQFGQPANVAVFAIDESEDPHFDSPSETPLVSSTHTFQDLPSGGYTFLTQGPWSGIECFGVSPCTTSVFLDPSTTFTPVLTVAEGGAGSYTARVVMPTVTGGPRVGTPLTVETSAGYKYLQAVAAQQGGQSSEHTQQWVRGTSDIPNATGATYTTASPDANQQVAVRLSPSPAIASAFANGGYVVPPYTTRAVSVTKVPTRTKPSFLGDAIRVKVRAIPGAVPEGKVKLSLGQLKIKAKLKKGKVTVALPPKLAPGQYTLKVSYLGSAAFEKSKSKPKTLTIS